MNLALPYLVDTGYEESISFTTNRTLAYEVRDLYVREDCWTVPDNFNWPSSENFNGLAKTAVGDNDRNHSLLFPLNFIPWRYRSEKRKGLARAFKSKLRRIKHLARVPGQQN
jgi:hypothetical protein